MSIINKVLNDLDQRNRHNATGSGHGSAVETSGRQHRPLLWGILVAVVAVMVAAGAYYALYMREPDAVTDPAEAVEQSASAVATKPQRDDDNRNLAEPVAAAPMPEPQREAAEQPKPQPEPQPERQPVQQPEQQLGPARDVVPERVASNEPEPQTEADDRGQFETSGSFTKQSVQLSATEIAERQRQKAEQAQQQGLFTDAATHFQAALNAQPQWHDVRKEWAALEYGRGQTTQALAILREGLQQFPQAHSLRLLAASMLEKQAQPQLALQLLVQRQPPATDLPQYYQLQATLAQQLGDNKVMEQSYQALVAVQPDNGRWRLGLALALKAQQPRQALTEVERAAAVIDHTPTLNFIAEQIKQLRSQHATSTP